MSFFYLYSLGLEQLLQGESNSPLGIKKKWRCRFGNSKKKRSEDHPLTVFPQRSSDVPNAIE